MNPHIEAVIGQPPPFDREAAQRAAERWSGIAKPLDSLGLLEKMVVGIAGLTGDHRYRIDRRAVLVLCADNGVVRQGVTQTGSEVTLALARFLAQKNISVCRMAEVAHADVIGVDMGMNEDLGLPELLARRVGAGTGDISEGPAMSPDQAILAIRHGIDLVRSCRDEGYRILATGEVGIGNTTSSSAMAAALLGRPAAEVTGRGAGLSREGVRRKAAIVEKALATNRPDPGDALDVLAKVGGFDIAGLVGVYLGGLMYRVPILIDGLISSVAALAAVRLCPEAKTAMFATHVSAEPAAGWLLEALGLRPLICAGMCLGEGTGAVAALPLLDMAYAVYDGMLTYEEISIGRYQPLD